VIQVLFGGLGRAFAGETLSREYTPQGEGTTATDTSCNGASSALESVDIIESRRVYMPKPSSKTRLLDAAGYKYNFDRMMYINRQQKKAFSTEFVDDHPEDDFVARIEEPHTEQDWRFYTNWPIAEGIERELKRVLG